MLEQQLAKLLARDDPERSRRSRVALILIQVHGVLPTRGCFGRGSLFYGHAVQVSKAPDGYCRGGTANGFCTPMCRGGSRGGGNCSSGGTTRCREQRPVPCRHLESRNASGWVNAWRVRRKRPGRSCRGRQNSDGLLDKLGRPGFAQALLLFQRNLSRVFSGFSTGLSAEGAQELDSQERRLKQPAHAWRITDG